MLEQSETPGRPVADVLIPVAVDQAYTYAVGDLDLALGDLVEVPLGPRATIGVVWALGASCRPGLKPVAARADIPRLPETLRTFVDWVARWTLSPRGMVLRMCLRAPFAAGPAAPRLGVRATGRAPTKTSATREKALAAAIETPLLGKGALAAAAGCTAGVVNALIADGALELAAIAAEPAVARLDAGHAPARLTPIQTIAAERLVAAVEARTFGVTLLEGVTGSGKTEVYLEAVAAALAAGRQALVLLPEIALTSQVLGRFATRFGAPPAEWHSAVPARRRHLVWHAVASGEAEVVIGARSALFLPFSDLAVIVVDEEHEAAFKQDDPGRQLPCPRHGGGARADRGRGRGAGVRDAVAGDAGQCAPGSLCPSRPAGPLRRAAAALHRRDRPAARPAARAAASSRRRWSRRSARRSPAASRRFSSSIVVATHPSRCAAPAAIASNVRIARPGWSSTGFATSSCATIAATRSGAPRPARSARACS